MSVLPDDNVENEDGEWVELDEEGEEESSDPDDTFRYAQGSKGIRQWPINLCTSLLMHKITLSVD